jgi:hypothetical protein
MRYHTSFTIIGCVCARRFISNLGAARAGIKTHIMAWSTKTACVCVVSNEAPVFDVSWATLASKPWFVSRASLGIAHAGRRGQCVKLLR